MSETYDQSQKRHYESKTRLYNAVKSALGFGRRMSQAEIERLDGMVDNLESGKASLLYLPQAPTNGDVKRVMWWLVNVAMNRFRNGDFADITEYSRRLIARNLIVEVLDKIIEETTNED